MRNGRMLEVQVARASARASPMAKARANPVAKGRGLAPYNVARAKLKTRAQAKASALRLSAKVQAE